MKKKNKKFTTKKRATVEDGAAKEAAADELVALKAIFEEELVLHDNAQGFTLRVVPHPGAAQVNYVSVELEVK